MTSYHKIHYNKEKIIIFMMIIAIFIGIFSTLNSWLKLKDNELKNELLENRIATTEKLTAEANQKYFIVNKILPLLKFICETNDADIIEIQKEYLKNYDLDISIYLFDNKGNLEATAPKKAPNQWLIKNLFPLLIERNLNKVSEGSRLLDKKIEFTFGYGKNLVSIRDNPEKIINTVSSGKECFFTWSNRNNKGILIFGNRLPESHKILDLALKKINKDKNIILAGKLQDFPKTEQELISSQAHNYISQKSLDYGIYDNKEWYFSTDKDGDRFYTSYKLTSNIYSRTINYLKGLFIIIVTLTILLSSDLFTTINLSLKQIVKLLFLASSIIPFAAISSMNLDSIKTYSDLYKNELKSAMEERISKIIQDFDKYINLCSNKITDLTEPENNIYNLEEIEKSISEEFVNSKFSARNSACEIIYSNFPAYSSGQESLFKSIGRQFLKRHNIEKLNEKEYKGNPFSDEIVTKDDLGIIALTNYPNKLQYFYNQSFRMLVYIKILPKDSVESALFFIFLDLLKTNSEYIKSIDPRTLIFNHQQIKLAAFNPLEFKWIISPSSKNDIFLEQAKATFIKSKPTFRIIKINGENYYSFCISNSETNGICYQGYISLEKLEREIRNRKFYINFSAVIALILFVSIIYWIMTQLITPLTDLETGVKALEKQKYEVRIPVPEGNDELVHLFKEFNFMMGENYDMQLAKNVQEALITNDFPQPNGYTIIGRSFPLNNLGRDCLSTFELKDGKILFLIGDLTGYKFGAAILVAFVRSITFNWCQRNEQNPITLCSAIDKMFRDNKMKKTFIGLICGIFNPLDNKISFVTRGHSFPLFIRKNGTFEWIGHPSLPLGIGHKKESILQETELLPGDRMFCFTSGLIEIKCHGGLTTGYELVKDWALQTSNNCDNKDWLDKIKNCYDNWCHKNKAVQTDDLTLFAIISNKSEEQRSDE